MCLGPSAFSIDFLKEALTWNAPRAKTQSFQFIPNVSFYAIQVYKKLQSVYFVHSHSILRHFMKMNITEAAYTWSKVKGSTREAKKAHS